MSAVLLAPDPAPEPVYRHAAGDDSDGCSSCWFEAVEAIVNGDEPVPGCFEPGDDGDGHCPVCGHVTEVAS